MLNQQIFQWTERVIANMHFIEFISGMTNAGEFLKDCHDFDNDTSLIL